MPDRGVNAVDHEPSIVDTVLTPRLAMRFERALAADEAERPRTPRTGGAALGPGLFALAMAARDARAGAAATRASVADPVTLRALAMAALACGREHTDGRAGEVAPVRDEAGEARLARAAALPMAALLDEAIAATADVAARAGDGAALAWFVATAARLDARVASVALGVIANLPGRAAEAPAALTAGFVRAREAIAARRRALGRAIELRAARDGVIAAAAEAARRATAGEIDEELAAAVAGIEAGRARELAAIERWHAHERPSSDAAARVARDGAIAAAASARRSAIDAAHDERLAAIAAHHRAAMAAIERAQVAYDAATAGRTVALDGLGARWERELASIQRIEEPEVRRRLTERGRLRLEAERTAARAREDEREAEARAARDEAIARAEADDEAGRTRAEERYRAQVEAIELAHERAVRAAEVAHGDAGRLLARAAAARRAAIEQAAVEATRAAHDRAARRRAHELEAKAKAAAAARAAALDGELAALEREVEHG